MKKQANVFLLAGFGRQFFQINKRQEILKNAAAACVELLFSNDHQHIHETCSRLSERFLCYQFVLTSRR